MSGQSVLSLERSEPGLPADVGGAIQSVSGEAPPSSLDGSRQGGRPSRDHAEAMLSPDYTLPAAVSRRDLLFAARILELPGAVLLSTADLVSAIRNALSIGEAPERIEQEVRALVETLKIAGRPTAANGLLQTLRTVY